MKTDSSPRSPFLPGTKVQFAWDSTSLSYLKTCPRLYKYIMIDGWGSTDESVHLRFGSEYHKALEGYARLRAGEYDHENALHATVLQVLYDTYDDEGGFWKPDEETKAGKYKNRRTLVRAVVDYLDHYKDDPAKVYIKKDGEPAVELSFSFELEWGPKASEVHYSNNIREENQLRGHSQPYLLCGHLDRVVEFTGNLFVMDHKTTTSTVSPHYFEQWSPSNQMTLYTIASQIILESPIKGVIIDATQLMVDSSRFVRGFTYRTPDQISEWMLDLHSWLSRAEEYAVANYWPQNDTACDKFGGCRFREVCSKSPQVREAFLKSDFDKLTEEERWNPLKPR